MLDGVRCLLSASHATLAISTACATHYAEARCIPSQQRICKLIRFTFETATGKLLERLVAAGYLERTLDDEH